MAEKKTTYTVAQRNQLFALGANLSDVRAFESDGFEFDEALEQLRTIREAKDLDRQSEADRSAKATKRAMRPENETAPGVSAYHPKGTAHAVEPVCETFWIGNPVLGDVDTDEEVALINQVQPGVYRCEKADGTPFNVFVEAERDAAGNMTKKKISFPCSGQQRHNHKSRLLILQEMLAQTPRVQEKPVELLVNA